MKKGVKIGGFSLGLIVLLGISYVLYNTGLMNYLIITGAFSVICAIVLVNTIITTRTDEAQYKSKLRQILRTYDSILVSSKNLPKLDNLNIIRVDSMEDLVDAQMEIRKPIYYQEQTESCAFVLLDNMTACFYVLKVNDDVLCPLEITINELEIISRNNKKAEEEDIPEDLLSEIERTTIIRLKKGKYVKVSPMGNRKKAAAKEEIKEKVLDKTQKIKTVVEDKVEEAKEIATDTKEKIEKTVDDTKNIIENKTEEIKSKAENIKDIIKETNEDIKKAIEDKKEEVEETKEAISEKTEDIKEIISDNKDKINEKIELIKDKADETKEVIEKKAYDIKKTVNHEKKKNKIKTEAKEIAFKAVDKSYTVKKDVEDLLLEDNRNVIEKTVDKVSEEVDKAKTKAKINSKINEIVDSVADHSQKNK